MRMLMHKRGGMALGIAKGLERRQPDIVFRDGVESLVASVASVRFRTGNEAVGLLDARKRLLRLLGELVEVGRQSVALIGTENRVSLEERNLLLDLLASVGGVLLLESAGVDDL
jgi:hypothetical protein